MLVNPMRGLTHTGPSRTGSESGSGGVRVCASSGRATNSAIAMPPSARKQDRRRPAEDAVDLLGEREDAETINLSVCTVPLLSESSRSCWRRPVYGVRAGWTRQGPLLGHIRRTLGRTPENVRGGA